MKSGNRTIIYLAAARGMLLTVGFLLVTACTPTIPATDGTAPIDQFDSTSPVENELPEMNGELIPGQRLRFINLSLVEGLSQSTIFAMVQDQQGFLWFGTEDGLNKYDGYNFTVYRHDPDQPNSLSDNWILSLFEDKAGTLWIGTREGGLNRYDSRLDQFTHFQNDPGDPSSISDNEINTIFQDREGFIWVGTGDGGLNKYVPEEGIIALYQHIPGDPNSVGSNTITEVIEDQNGYLWVGTEQDGLSRFDPETERWQHYRNNSADPDSLSNNSIKSIFKDSSGVIWIGTVDGGLDRYDPKNDRFIHIQQDLTNPETQTSDATAVIFQDQDDKFWIGTEGGGLNRYDPETGTLTNYQHNPGDQNSLSSNYIISIIQDREGVLWFGSFGSGINKLSTGWRNFAHFQYEDNDLNSLSDNMVRTFLAGSNNSLWIGTLIGGLDWFDRENETWQHYINNPDDSNSISSNFISVIYEDSSRNTWIGTASGLDKFEPNTGTFTHYPNNPDESSSILSNNIRTMFESASSKFWIGTRSGLFRFDSEKEHWDQHYQHDPDDPLSLSDDWIFSSLEDQEGRIWLGTVDGGLNRFDPKTEIFTHYHYELNDPQSLSNNFVMSIFQDSRGKLWIGTPGGLDKFDSETETFIHYREKDGLPNNTVYCILEDKEGFLWLSTNKGLSRFDTLTETFKNYDVNDGLQSNEFNGNACSMVNEGEMAFGGINGFNIFSPGQLTTNTTFPPIVLTSITQDGEELNLGVAPSSLEEITFNWPNNGFEFEFAALSFSNPAQNQYAYMLEGFDDDWIDIGTQRYGKYTNLPGGNYTLRLIGSNDDGFWNEEGIALGIKVIPPFWGTGWFWGLILAAVIGASYGGFKLRVRNLEKRSRELEIQVKDRTDELMDVYAALKETDLERVVNEERNRLARELHDSVTQSLYSLTLFTEAARHLSEATGDEKLEGYLGQIGNLGLQSLKEMRLLVFELGLHALEEDDLVEALEKRLKAVEGRTGIDVKVINEGYHRLPAYIETQLFKIAQETLNNALKHAEASSVEVHFREDGSSLEMEIIDNGIGFTPDPLKAGPGMGLKNIRDRVRRVDGKLEIDSAPGKGTRLKVTINAGRLDEKNKDAGVSTNGQ